MAVPDITRVGYIYALLDSRESDPVQAVRYVGRTVTGLQRRMRAHLQTAKCAEPTYRARWMRSVIAGGGSVIIRPLAVVELGECNQAEQEWIAHYRALGAKLTNLTDGGAGLLNAAPETRARIGASKRGNKYWVGKKHTPESKAKMSARRTGQPMHPRTRAAIFRPETAAKIAATLRAKQLTPEQLEVKRQHVRTYWHSDEAKAKSRATRQQPEYRAALSKAARSPERLARTAAMGRAGKGRKASVEARALMAVRQQGRRHSLQTKAKMSAWQQGESSHRAKLTWPQVRVIRERYALGGISQHQLARDYHVQPRTINLIVHGATWAECPLRGALKE